MTNKAKNIKPKITHRVAHCVHKSFDYCRNYGQLCNCPYGINRRKDANKKIA